VSASISSFKTTVEKLIRRFESDRSHYLSKSYSEAQARVDFITPFFKALGWDVENEEGLAHHSREVVVEAAEDTGGRPDYGFRVSGQTKFFVEAKAPSEELDTAKHIIQAKSYAWNTKQVFLVVLTDFEEFRFYDASIKPDVRKPDEGLLLKLKYTGYIAGLEKLWEFSKERVLAGSLEAMLPRDRRTQRLRIPVDTSFLDEMTGWREEVARNVYKNNPGLTAKQLNEIVQRLLDRIVFIRIAEDRRVIEKNQLRDVVEEWKARGGKYHIFEWLNDLFHRINEDFNGEIFKPHLSEDIKIDSEVLARIIERLYPPQSLYRFDVIGVELLGSIYERYLGSTIRVTAKRVFVEEKPEVRKAGGVYYTPEYIVNYIVQNTVGKVIEGKTPKQIEKTRILDPACGSGSFLIGAFQCLIDYHVRYLSEHPKEAEVHPLFPDVLRGDNGQPRLSVIRKARILRNNLFGVDIDPQAVEITMMSLYLKALEGEKSQLPPKQHILPELKDNIICGNSLVGTDIYKQRALFADEERDRINAFDWHSQAGGFGHILKEGGFDCVIGNPPYLYSAGQNFPDYFGGVYKLSQYQTDFYVFFIEKALLLARPGGKVSFIVSDSWLNSERISKLRSHLLANHRIELLAVFDFPVFEQAVLENSVFVVTVGGKPKQIPIARFLEPGICATDNHIDPSRAAKRGLIDPRISSAAEDVIAAIEKCSEPLERFLRINRGIHAYRVDGYGKSKFGPGPQTKRDKETRSYHADKRKDETYLPELKGKDVDRYDFTPTGEFLSYGPWLAEPREPEFFYGPKLALRKILGPKLHGTLIEKSSALDQSLYVLVSPDDDISELKFFLGLLLSRLGAWYLRKKYAIYDALYPWYTKKQLAAFPVKYQDNRVVVLVDQMLELNKRTRSGKLAPSELGRLEQTSHLLIYLTYLLYVL
jgi:hypothetical protein